MHDSAMRGLDSRHYHPGPERADWAKGGFIRSGRDTDADDVLPGLPFISRHIPTAAQQATVAERFGALVCTEPLVFEPGRVSEQVRRAISLSPDKRVWTERPALVAGVFPGWALLELLRGGWTVVEFVNDPDARHRGQFVCRGAFVHTLQMSEFLTCPTPVEQQNADPLLGGLRS